MFYVQFERNNSEVRLLECIESNKVTRWADEEYTYTVSLAAANPGNTDDGNSN